MQNIRVLNGYRLIYKPDFHASMENENWKGYVYEHIYFAEQSIGRKLRDSEIVHHLDGNRSNNRYENLLVIEQSQHRKLHKWIDKGAPFEELNGKQRMNSGKSKTIKTCDVCNTTLQLKQKHYCSLECSGIANRKCEHPTKERLRHLLKNNSREAVGRMFGVSGNAVKKWQRKFDLL